MFLNQPLGGARAGFGRPDITIAGGLEIGLPEFHRTSNGGGLTPSFNCDSRDNVFTPSRGTYVETVQKIATGGVGFRYELARKYGIHAGLDLAFSPGNQAVYIQVGSAWARP